MRETRALKMYGIIYKYVDDNFVFIVVIYVSLFRGMTGEVRMLIEMNSIFVFSLCDTETFQYIVIYNDCDA